MRGESETWENGIYIHPYDRFHMTSRRPHWVQNNEMAAMLVFQKTFCGDWILFSCKNFLLFQEICLAANHVSENDLLYQFLSQM